MHRSATGNRDTGVGDMLKRNSHKQSGAEQSLMTSGASVAIGLPLAEPLE